MTRDREQIFLNEIHALCMEAADHYEAAVSTECFADRKDIYSKAAQDHRRLAAELAVHIRMHDDQPKLPDPDKETMELFFASIKARLATSERQSLIEDQTKREDKLRIALETALQSDVPSNIRPVLERLLANANTMLQTLQERQ